MVNGITRAKKVFYYLIFTFVFFSFSLGQSVSALSPCPNFVFTTDLKQGVKHEDVYHIQEILNLDNRTRVADAGPGSPGSETIFFGVATREALKRFQALFIEYIGVADGKFNTKTRTSMNAVCKGPFFTKKVGSVYDTKPATNTTPLLIAVAGPSVTNVDEPVRAYVSGSRAIKTPPVSALIIENGTAGDLRKVSSTTYSFLVVPDADADGPITLQFEADTVSDLADVKNELASNEWVIQLTGLATSTITTDPTLPDLSLIDLPVVTPSNIDCSTVGGVDINDYTNPCYGKAPIINSNPGTSDSGGGGGGGGGAQQIMQMLQGLLKSLLGGGGGNQTGGKTGGDAMCACSGLPTTGYSPIGPGIGGRQSTLGVEFSGNFYTGQQGPPPPICGARIRSGPKDQCSGIPGPHNSTCCGIMVDVTLQPVTGSLLPIGKRSN